MVTVFTGNFLNNKHELRSPSLVTSKINQSLISSEKIYPQGKNFVFKCLASITDEEEYFWKCEYAQNIRLISHTPVFKNSCDSNPP